MKQHDQLADSWVAGLLEQRVSLGIAAAASLALVVMLVLGPSGNTPQAPEQRTSSPDEAVQSVSSTPRFSIPDKSEARPKPARVSAPPTIKPAGAITRAGQPGTSTRTKQAERPKPASTQNTSKPRSTANVAPRPSPRPAPVSKPASTQTSGTTPAVARKATTPGKVFFVQVGAYRERSSAQQQAAMLLQKGWNSMVSTNARGLYVVRIGPASSRDAAARLRSALLNKAKLKGFIVEG